MYKIGEIAKQAGVTTRTLRYYEQLGLLSPSEVSTKGYRYYNDNSLNIITRIRSLQHVGLSLDEIKDVIGLYFKQKKQVEAKEKTLNYLHVHLNEIEQKIKLLHKAKAELKEQIQTTQQRLSQLAEKGQKNGGSKS
ncbi:MAG: MerR family transcriptional regulator [Bacteroidota bacterium]|nr:MerR family transcriptional regulator [Bacteroidota bacterium]